MDFSIVGEGLELGAPAIVWANYYQFSPGEVVTNEFVISRAFIWGVAGAGTVTCDGQEMSVAPSRWVFLPWRHDVVYRADVSDPFMVGAVHVIPWHDPAVPIELHAAHGRGDLLADLGHRQDHDWAELRGIIQGSAEVGRQLLTLAALAVEIIQQERPAGPELRALAVLLLSALRRATDRPAHNESLPPTLVRMQQHIAAHLGQRLAVGQIAGAGGISESTAQRLFLLYTGGTVGEWLRARRIEFAAELLRTTNASVESVGRSVGFDDPSYFSRVFRRVAGVPPRTFARQSRLI